MFVNAYKRLWCAYLQIFRGKNLEAEALKLELTSLKSADYTTLDGNIFVIFNSGRVSDLDLIRSVITKRHSIEGRDLLNKEYYFTDVHIDGFLRNKHSIRRCSVVWSIRHILTFILMFIKTRSIPIALIGVYSQIFRIRRITKLELFTCNSRLNELMRIAAIKSGIQITEYLHGICSDVFANYYRLLHSIAANQQLSYVNMAPRLPQPDIIRDHQIWHNSLEVYFKNEAPWKSSRSNTLTDVTIVGSDIPDGVYWQTKLFNNDLKLMNLCQNYGLEVVYCPHPLIYKQAHLYVPNEIKLGFYRDYVNSTKLLVGHFSTALFVAHLFGKNILLFEDAVELIPAYFFNEILDPSEVIFNKNKMFELIKRYEIMKEDFNQVSIGFSLDLNCS